jgi:hypothetical protein
VPAQVTPLLAIHPNGSGDVTALLADLDRGRPAQAATADVALSVLTALGCDPRWASARVHYALTGEWRPGG